MYKLLIVDDEPLVQVGIKSMINWSELDIEVIGTAVNGKVALSMMQELSPDIIITDIKMPVMDGLELIKNARREFGSDYPDFIILTSYEDFHLVKEAIKYQVTDYLIKVELDSSTLTQAVERSLERVKKYRPETSSSKADDTLIESLNDKFFIRLLNNLFEQEDQFESQAKDLALNFNYGSFVCSYGCLDDKGCQELPLEKKLALFQNSVQMIRELANKYLNSYVIGLDARHFAIIFCIDEKNDISLGDGSHFEKIMDSINEALLKYMNISFVYGVGRPVNQATNIYESCKMARNILKGKSQGEDSDGQEANHIVRNVKKYIREHVCEKLTLNDVAYQFNISPNYLSQLFSKYNDYGFTEYVSICKVKESKKLLKQGNLKVYEIADMMGFESSFYFSKVFKKYEGISPTDYLNSAD